MNLQLHVGQYPTAERFKPIANRWHKPLGGLWTSTYDPQYGSDWVQWCLSESFGVPPSGWLAWVLTLNPTARVLMIDSLEGLRRMCRQYAMRPCDGICAPDFVAISRDFDAVHLTERGQWRTRLSHPHSLYGWDCESTVWLRWAFTSVEALGCRTWPMRNLSESTV